MPVFVLLGISGCFLVHPVAELILSEKREFIEVLGAVIVVGSCSALLKACAVERDLISGFHKLVNTLVLLFKDSLVIFGINRLFFYFRVSGQRIDVFQFVVQFVVAHRLLLIIIDSISQW